MQRLARRRWNQDEVSWLADWQSKAGDESKAMIGAGAQSRPEVPFCTNGTRASVDSLRLRAESERLQVGLRVQHKLSGNAISGRQGAVKDSSWSSAGAEQRVATAE